MKILRYLIFDAIALFALLGISSVAQQTTGALPDNGREAHANIAPVSGSPGESHTIHIGYGDLLEIKVFGIPDLATEGRVSSSGEISMGLVGEVKVQGLTIDGAQKAIEQRFREGGFLKNPHVTVFVKEYSSQGITVLGEVQKPGIYTLLGSPRLFDAISAAGGVTSRAGRLVTLTHRDHPESPIVLEREDSNGRSGKTAGEAFAINVDVFPGDTVVVSKAGMVYVVGDVARPSGFIMENNDSMTVLQALAMAQGANGTASLGKALLIHKLSATEEEQPLDLKKMLQAKSPDVPMRPEDILFVPKSMGKAASKTALSAIVQTAVGLAIYRP